jgi:hypothetical protein
VILKTELQQPDLSPRELACYVTDHAGFTDRKPERGAVWNRKRSIHFVPATPSVPMSSQMDLRS